MAVNSAIRLVKQGDLKMMFEGNWNHQQTCSMILARVQKLSADIQMTRMYAKRWKKLSNVTPTTAHPTRWGRQLREMEWCRCDWEFKNASKVMRSWNNDLVFGLRLGAESGSDIEMKLCSLWYYDINRPTMPTHDSDVNPSFIVLRSQRLSSPLFIDPIF